MGLDITAVVQQIDNVLAEAEALGGRSVFQPGPPDWNDQAVSAAVALVVAGVDRLAPPGSSYLAEARTIRGMSPNATPGTFHRLAGVLKALRADYAADRLQGVRELLHADLFADLLDGAEHLLGEGFKDPAAVIAGASLEAHLRNLAAKHGVPTTGHDGKPRKTSTIAEDLAKTIPPALTKLDSKSVVWALDVRNKAAHGHFGEYNADTVSRLIQTVRDLMTRLPA